MKNHFGRFLLVFVIVALCAIAWMKTKPPIRLGLDLAGGSSLTYQVKVAEGELTPDRVKRTIDVVDKRLNGIGVSEISIVPTQQNEIVIELPGRTAEQIKDIKAKVEREQREMKEALDVRMSQEYMWVPQKNGGPDMLVKTPERPLLAALNKLK